MRKLHEFTGTVAITEMLEAIDVIDYAIAGGYPRDLVIGKQPKDLDIVVAPLSITPEEVSQIIKINSEHLVDSVETVLSFKHLTGDHIPAEYRDGRILHVFKYVVSDTIENSFWYKKEVDLIIYKHNDVIEIVSGMFDYNINSYIMVGNEPSFCGRNEGTLELCAERTKSTVSKGREAKAVFKAKQAGWSISNNL